MTETFPSRQEEDYGGRVSRGLRWSVVNTVVLRLGSLVTGAVLLRLISPAEYGVYAAALVIVTALLSMNELGMSLAIVRRRSDVRSIAPTVATLALLTSVGLYVATYLAAPLAAGILNAPSATTMIRVLAACVLIDAVATVPAQVLSREFAQGRRFAIDLAAFLTGTALSVVLAFAGYGAWALVWGFLLTNVVAGGMALLLTPWRSRYGFDRGTARELLGFGLPLAGSSLLLFAMMNVDYLVVGNLLGATALGLYLNAFTLASWPVNLVSTTIRRVTLSAFSRAADSTAADRDRAFLTSLRAVLVLTVPMCVGLAVFAEEIIGTLYGDRWTPAAEALRPLAVLALARVVVELTYDYLVAADRNGSNFLIQCIWLVSLIPALVVGAHLDGIRGVGRAHAVVVLSVIAVTMTVALHRAGISITGLLRASARPLLAGVPMGVVGWCCVVVIDEPLFALLIGGTSATVVYAAINAKTILSLWANVQRTTPP